MDPSITMLSSPQFYQCKYGRVQLLTTENHVDWSSTLRNFLEADDTWEIVQGIEKAPMPPELMQGSSSSRIVGRRRGTASSQATNQHQEEMQADLEAYEEALEAHEEGLKDFKRRSARARSMILSSVSHSLQHYISGMTDPVLMWETLKKQLDTVNADAGPFIIRAQFFKEKHTGDGPLSVFFAKLSQYQFRLANTDYQLPDIDLVSHILSFGTLPSRFDPALHVLRMQGKHTWAGVTQSLINMEIQLNTLNPPAQRSATASALTADMVRDKNRNKKSKGKGNYRGRRNGHHSSRGRDDSDESDEDKHHIKRKGGIFKSKSRNGVQCFHCGKRVHKRLECLSKK